MKNVKKTLNLIALSVFMGSNLLTPISYAIDDLEFEIETPQLEADSTIQVVPSVSEGGGDSLTNLENDWNIVPLWERGDGEAEGIFSGREEKILSPSDSSFQKEAQESDKPMDSSATPQNDGNTQEWNTQEQNTKDSSAEASEWQGDENAKTDLNDTVLESLLHFEEGDILTSSSLPWKEDTLEQTFTWENLIKEARESELNTARETLNETPIIWTSESKGVTVDVEAPAGTFPEWTELRILPIILKSELNEIKDDIMDSDQWENVIEKSEIVAFDISFIYILRDGEEIEVQPKENTVKVTFNYEDNKDLSKADDNKNQEVKVFHIEEVVGEDGNETWKKEVNEVTNKSESVADGIAVADAESFSIYAVIRSEETANITVQYDANGWTFNWLDTTKSVTYTKNGDLYIASENVQAPNKAWRTCENNTKYCMFDWWYTDTTYATEWYGVEADTTTTSIEVYAKWLPFDDLPAVTASDGTEYILMDRNLWATDVWNYGDAQNTAAKNGKYYQWWNNHGFPASNGNWNTYAYTSNTPVDASAYWPGNYYSSATFILRPDSQEAWYYYRWDTTDNANLWWWTSSRQSDKQWPCPAWYHVPTTAEWKAIYDALDLSSSEDSRITLQTTLHLPMAGYRFRANSNVYDQGSYGYYWSSSRLNASNAYHLYFDSSAIRPQDSNRRSYGFSVRCLKDSPTHTLTFNATENGASTTSQPSVEAITWSSVTLPSCNETKTGFTCIWWNTDATAHEGLASITLNEDKTVYAIFSKTLTASFVLVDDDAATLSSSTSTCTYYNKESVCSLSSPTLTAKSWYTVDGWSSTNWGTTTTTTFVDEGTYYSVTHNNTPVTVTFNANGNGGPYSPQSCYKYNGNSTCSITSPAITPANGFTTIWWSTANDRYENDWTAWGDKEIWSSATYFAQTQKAGYTVTLNYSNGAWVSSISPTSKTCNVATVYNGDSQVWCYESAPTVNCSAGYSNPQWNTSLSAAVLSDTTYTATCSDTTAPTIEINTQPSTSCATSKVVKATLSDWAWVTVSKYAILDSSTCESSIDSTATWNNYTSATNLTLDNEDYNNKYVCFKASDAAGNTSYLATNQITNIDTAGPWVPSLSTPANNTYTNNNKPTLTWTAWSIAWCSTLANYEIQICGDSSCNTVEQSNTSATNTTWTLTTALNDGTYYWRVREKDSLNRYSDYTDTKSFVVDTTPPTCVISWNPTSWQNTNATLTVTMDDANVKTDGYSWDNSTYSSSKTHEVSANWTYTAYVKDKAWNEWTCSETVTKIDTTAPNVWTITINSDATYSTSPSVILTLNASDEWAWMWDMRFSCDNSNWSTWESYTTTKNWNLNTGDGCSAWDGEKTVYVQFRDALWNGTKNDNDSILLDTSSPTAPTCTANACYKTSQSVTCNASEWTIKYTTNGEDPTCSSATWENQSFSATTTLKVAVCDAAWNLSDINTYAYTADNSAPSIPTMTAEPTYTQWLSNTVTASTVTDNGCNGNVQYQFCKSTADSTTNCSDTNLSNWSSSTSATFTNLTDGQKYYYFVRTKDGLWNTSEWSSSTSSTQDNSAPNISFENPVNQGPSIADDVAVDWDDATVKKWKYSDTNSCPTISSSYDKTDSDTMNQSDETNNWKYICLYAEDALWNATQLPSAYPINIDITAPILSFGSDVLVWPVKSNTVTATWWDATTKKWMYSTSSTCSDTEWDYNKTYSDSMNQTTQANNGKYICLYAKDEAWNVSKLASEYPINIDTTPPTCSISWNPENWTNQSVTLTVTMDDTNVKTDGYSWNGTTYSSTQTTTATSNGTYTAYVKDKAWNEWNCSVTVTKIDTTRPVASIESTNTLKSDSQTATLSCTDWVWISKYYWWTSSSPADNQYTTLWESTTDFSTSKTVNEAWTYYLFCRDEAGNVSTSVNKTYNTYTVHNMLNAVDKAEWTYNTTNYPQFTTATYIIPSQTNLTLANIYSIPSNAKADTYRWYTTSDSGNPSTDSSVIINGNTNYYFWFDRESYTLTLTKWAWIQTIYYKVNWANAYTDTTVSTTLDMKAWSDAYVYAVASNGYSYNTTSLSNPVQWTDIQSAKSFEPDATLNTYTITYHLDWWAQENPKTSYTVEDSDFTLINPTRTHYLFAWWTWNNGNNPEVVVTITQWSKYENLEYYANWYEDFNDNGENDAEEIKYTVTIDYVYSRGWEASPTYTALNQLSGFTYNVDSPEIANYYADQTNLSGTITWNVNITVTYKPNTDDNNNGIADEDETHYTLTIHYVNTHSGTVFADYTGSLVWWADYNVVSPTKNHYTLAPETVTGTMPDEDLEIYVTYTPDVDRNNNGIADSEENLPDDSGSRYSGWGWKRSNTNNNWISDAEQNTDNQQPAENDFEWNKDSELVITDHNKEVYSSEVIDAYKWAYNNDITTINSLDKAKPNNAIIRGHMAKVVVNYAVNVLWKEAPEEIPEHCKWNDNTKDWESAEIKEYAEKACALWIMWINVNTFQPKNVVSRAEFGTILSRMLRWDKYDVAKASKEIPYYENHLKELKEKWIMTQIDNPLNRKELRKWVWVMLKRTSEI